MAFLVAMFINWKQTMCVVVLMPIVGAVGVWATKVCLIRYASIAITVQSIFQKVVKLHRLEQEAAGKAACLIFETLRSIRTVLSFNGQEETLRELVFD